MLLEMSGITKSFPGVKALDQVSVELKKGEIVAIIGENGAGKSTLIKILSGAYLPEAGTINIDGECQSQMTPIAAIKKGIGIIYQELNSVDQLTVAENIFMGNLPQKKGLRLIDYQQLKKQTQEILDKMGLELNPFRLMGELSIAEKQLVEIAKALSKELKILVMDEPTAALNSHEIDTLFMIVKQLATSGIGILYISHRMEEIFRLAERVIVLRDGKKVQEVMTKKTNIDQLIHLMVGRKIENLYPAKGELLLNRNCCFRVKNLSGQRFEEICFEVYQGEIIGIFGLMGCGAQEIGKAIFGAVKYVVEDMTLNGKKIRIRTPQDAKREGIAYIPADRKREGLMLIHSLAHNMTVTDFRKIKKWRLINRKKEAQFVSQWIERLSIKTPRIDTIIDYLSGGNQQKVVLAKWLSNQPSLLVMDEPTRGVDVGAKAEIYKLMKRLCDQGIGIIMVSSDLPEVMGMADRILVIQKGKVSGMLERQEFTQDKILAKAIGV